MFCIKTSKFAIQNVFILKLCFQTHFNTKCDIINFSAKCDILMLKIMFIKRKRGYSPIRFLPLIVIIIKKIIFFLAKKAVKSS